MTESHDHPLLADFARERCSAILRTPLGDAVAPAMEAAIEGGFRIVEFTLNTPSALAHIASFTTRPGLIVGAGTVLSIEDAARARIAGARFLVAPVVDEEVIRFGVAQGLLVIPGAFTPTEMLRAWRAGAQMVKLFPGPSDGPQYLRACRGPLPFLRLFPTSGVTLENAAAYLEAGAFGLGWVNCLFDPADLAAGNWERIRTRAAQMVAASRPAD